MIGAYRSTATSTSSTVAGTCAPSETVSVQITNSSMDVTAQIRTSSYDGHGELRRGVRLTWRIGSLYVTRRRDRDGEELYRSCDSRMYTMRPTKS